MAVEDAQRAFETGVRVRGVGDRRWRPEHFEELRGEGGGRISEMTPRLAPRVDWRPHRVQSLSELIFVHAFGCCCGAVGSAVRCCWGAVGCAASSTVGCCCGAVRHRAIQVTARVHHRR